jgi:hypothetical protein
MESINVQVFAFLGRYNLGDDNELNWQKRLIIHKILHDNFKSGHEDHLKSDGDISVLVMEKAVQFTDSIQPICLPKSNEIVFDVYGIVAGYGRPDRYGDASKFPLHVELKTTDIFDCFSNNIGASKVVSRRSFCAAGPNGIPCYGNFYNLY